jgi:hypothetical protein
MRKAAIVFVEIGMLIGIVLAAFMVPGNTSIATFAMISSLVFLLECSLSHQGKTDTIRK